MKCPNCGSNNFNLVPITTTYVEERVKGFGCFKACIGWLLFSVPGILCGLCGMGKGKRTTTHHTSMVNICQNCGRRF